MVERLWLISSFLIRILKISKVKKSHERDTYTNFILIFYECFVCACVWVCRNISFMWFMYTYVWVKCPVQSSTTLYFILLRSNLLLNLKLDWQPPSSTDLPISATYGSMVKRSCTFIPSFFYVNDKNLT